MQESRRLKSSFMDEPRAALYLSLFWRQAAWHSFRFFYKNCPIHSNESHLYANYLKNACNSRINQLLRTHCCRTSARHYFIFFKSVADMKRTTERGILLPKKAPTVLKAP